MEAPSGSFAFWNGDSTLYPLSGETNVGIMRGGVIYTMRLPPAGR